MKTETTQLRFCLKAVCLYEALSGASYQAIDLAEEETRLLLLYAMYMAERSNKRVSLETFALLLESEQIASALVREAISALELQNSLSRHLPNSPSTEGEGESGDSPSPLSPLIARLIVQGGLSAEYVLYDMGLWELPLYLEAIAEERAEQMERERLWCYLGLSPYLDGSKVKSPRDFLPLPHELADIAREEAQEQEALSLLLGLQGKT